jgi:hypothetical protein
MRISPFQVPQESSTISLNGNLKVSREQSPAGRWQQAERWRQRIDNCELRIANLKARRQETGENKDLFKYISSEF